MVVKLSTFLSTSLAEGLDSALVTGIIANTDVALDSGTSGNYIAEITGGAGITALNAAAHEATAIIKVDSATIPTLTNTKTFTNKTINLTNNTLSGTLGQFNAALNGATFVSTDGAETLTSKTLTSPTINTPTITGPGSFTKVSTLGMRDITTTQFDTRLASNSSTALTDNRTITFDVENVNRTVKLGGNLTIDKDLRTAGDFNLLMNLTDSTNITLPTSGTVMQFDSNGASSITGAFSAGTLTGVYQGADSDITVKVTKAFVDALNVDAATLGGRDSDYLLDYNNFTNTPTGSVALASLGVNPPSSPANGQIWWDDSGGNLYIYYVDSDGDTQWVEAVPQLAAQDFVSTANITNTSTGTTFASNSFNIVKIQTDKDDNGTNDDAILQFTNGSANTVKAELRFDESTSTFEIGRGDNQNHMSMNDSGITTFSERVHIQGTNVDTGFGFNTFYTHGLDVGGMTTISGPNSYDALTVENTSTEFAGARIRLRDGNSTSGQYSYWNMNTDVVSFYSNNSNIAWQSTAAGVVSQPNKPAMSGTAIRDTNGGHNSGANIDTGYNVYLNTLRVNNGSHWNNSTGVWTCPVEGFYYVHASWLVDDNQTSGSLARYAWFHNGVEIYKCYVHDKFGSTYGGQHCAGGIMNCSANDTITIQATNGLWHSGNESGFSIHLL